MPASVRSSSASTSRARRQRSWSAASPGGSTALRSTYRTKLRIGGRPMRYRCSIVDSAASPRPPCRGSACNAVTIPSPLEPGPHYYLECLSAPAAQKTDDAPALSPDLRLPRHPGLEQSRAVVDLRRDQECFRGGVRAGDHCVGRRGGRKSLRGGGDGGDPAA